MTKEKALELYESKFWENMTDEEIVKFQLFESKLCMPFSRFHEAVEKCLERPVYTHEFGSAGVEQLKKEFLKEKPAPTLEDILNLIPEEKRIILITGEKS